MRGEFIQRHSVSLTRSLQSPGYPGSAPSPHHAGVLPFPPLELVLAKQLSEPPGALLLEAFGVTTAAAVFAASLVGPAQVAARLIEFTFLRRASPMISARLATGLHPLAAALLALVGSPAAVPFVLLHGAGNGLLTIARGTLPLALFGPAGYGLRTGVLAAPARILQGGAPLLFGVVLDRDGPIFALLLSGTLTGASFLALSLLHPRAHFDRMR